MRKPAATTLNPQFQPYSVLRAMWKQKYAAAAIWAIMTALTVFVVVQLPRTYEAQASVLVGGNTLSKDMVQSTVTTETQDRMEQIKQRVLSRDALMKMMETFQLHEGDRKSMPPERVVEYMRDEIDMKLDRGWGPNSPNTFRVNVQGKNAEATAKVANYLALFFVNENRAQRETQADAASEFFDQRMTDAKKQVELSEARLNIFKTTYAGELPQQQDALLATLSQKRTQLQGVQDGLTRIDQARLLLNNSLEQARNAELDTRRLIEQTVAARKRMPASAVTSVGGAPVPGLTEAQRLEGELAGLRQRYGDRHPDVRRALVRLDEAKAREAALAPAPSATAAQTTAPPAPADGLPETSIEGPERLLRQTLTEQHDRGETIKAQIQITQQDEVKLNAERLRVIAEIADIEARVRKLPMREQEMAAVLRDYEMGKTNYQSMVDKKLAADLSRQLEQGTTSATFQMLEPARTPEEPIKPRRSLLALGGSVFGLLLGLVAAVVLEMRKQVVLGEWELPPGTPVLGRIIEMPSQKVIPDQGSGRRDRKRALTA
jgi:polysaccharide biosynthesis transport protein